MKKVAIVHSGGSTKGGFGLGCLKAIAERDDLEIKVCAGTSVGALNLSLFAQEGGCVDLIEKVWNGVHSSKDIVANWPIPYIQSYLNGGVFTIKPLAKLLHKYFDKSKLLMSDIDFISCAVNLETGYSEYSRNTEEYLEHLEEDILNSARYPVMIAPGKNSKGQLCTDGGIRDTVPLDIVMDEYPDMDYYIIILTNPLSTTSWEPKVERKGFTKYLFFWSKKRKRRIHEILERTISLQSKEVFLGDLTRALRKEHFNTSRFIIIYPEKEINTGGTFGINQKLLQEMKTDGYNRAKFALEVKLDESGK